MDSAGKFSGKRRGLSMLKLGFALTAFLFLALFLLSISILGWKVRGPDDKTEHKEEFVPSDKMMDAVNEAEEITDEYYISKIQTNLNSQVVDPYSMESVLWEFSQFNKTESDIIKRIDNSIYISKLYLAYEEKLNDALYLALSEMEYCTTLIQKNDINNKIQYERESLSMLSSIYQMMGIRNVALRGEYYVKASDCIEKLLVDLNEDDVIYRGKLYDLVCLEDDLGNRDKALELLGDWTRGHKKEGKELYFKYILLLLQEDGNQSKIIDLKAELEDMEDARKDYRYEEIMQKITKYVE